jgi:hypothetical protein
MKKIILITFLCIGCGKESAPDPTPSPRAEVLIPSPQPETDLALVGNWVDGIHTLKINEDFTAQSDEEELTWALDNNIITFLSGPIQIDACVYQIESSGGIQTALNVSLKLYCEKSGALSYKKE